MTPTRRIVCLAAVAALGIVAGCTTVTKPDGSTSRVLGFESEAARDEVAATVKAATAALPFPFDIIAGTLSVVAIGAIGVVGKKIGEDKGWKDREQHQAKVVDAAYAAGAIEQPKIVAPPAAVNPVTPA